MKYTNMKDDYMVANGTCLQGYIDATRDELEIVFGAPFDWPEHDKVTTEWIIRFENGVVATVYDWKRYEEGRPGQFEKITWHIGGKSDEAQRFVHMAVNAKL